MKELLEDIISSPGVIGACVYSAKKGILAANLPVTFSSERQERISRILHRVFRLNDTSSLDVNAYELRYDEGLIMTRRLNRDTSLIIICATDVNVHLVAMACAMQAAELVQMLEARYDRP